VLYIRKQREKLIGLTSDGHEAKRDTPESAEQAPGNWSDRGAFGIAQRTGSLPAELFWQMLFALLPLLQQRWEVRRTQLGEIRWTRFLPQ